MSNRTVKRIRYALLLPALHLLIVAPPIFRRVERLGHYTAKSQAVEDYQTDHPPTDESSDYDWKCYEYRVSTADRLILSAEFPAAVLVGYDQECSPAAVRSILDWLLKYRVRVSSRIIVIDCLFLAGVSAQWLLIGRWLDLLHQRSMTTRWWTVVVAVISGEGILMAPSVFYGGRWVEHLCILTGMAALLAWLALLLRFAVVGIKKGWAVLRRPK